MKCGDCHLKFRKQSKMQNLKEFEVNTNSFTHGPHQLCLPWTLESCPHFKHKDQSHRNICLLVLIFFSYKSYYVPFKYRCSINKSDHIRPTNHIGRFILCDASSSTLNMLSSVTNTKC